MSSSINGVNQGPHNSNNGMNEICELNNRACVLLQEENHEQALQCLVSAMAINDGPVAITTSNGTDCAAVNASLQSAGSPSCCVSVDFVRSLSTLSTRPEGSQDSMEGTTDTSTIASGTCTSTAWHLPLFFTRASLPSSPNTPTDQQVASHTRHQTDQNLSFVLVYNMALSLQHMTLHPTIINTPFLRLPIAERSLNMYYHAQILLLGIFADTGASSSPSASPNSVIFAMPKSGICTTLLLNVGEVNRMMGYTQQADLCFQHAIHLLISARNVDAPVCTKEEAMDQFCERVLDATMKQDSAPAA